MDRPVKRDVTKRQHQQDSDEDVIAVVRRFPVVMRWPLIHGMLIILVGMIPWAFAMNTGADWLGMAYNWMFVAFAVLAWYWLREWVGWYYSIYLLTSTKLTVITQRGFFRRSVSDLALNNIQSVNYKIDGFQASAFGYGDVVVETLSGSGGFNMDFVHRPAKFQQKILDAVQAFDSTHPTR
ncbi:PH domain-containing protein [bacterium]|nr:PH domain-containing protein [bacterium]